MQYQYYQTLSMIYHFVFFEYLSIVSHILLFHRFLYLFEIKYNHFERIPPLLETKVTDFFGAHPIRTYLPEDLRSLFERHGFIVEHLAGKPVISSLMTRKVKKHKLDSHYDFILSLEKRFGEHPNYIGHGGHLQITAKKPL